MLKSFSGLYAGHILEGDGIGFAGVPVNDRRYTMNSVVEEKRRVPCVLVREFCLANPF
jgi:hypothetical protein